MPMKSLSKAKPKALAVPRAPSGKSKSPVAGESREVRFAMIREAAYFHALNAGFTGDSAEHWFAAEREIDRLLGRA
ncbi:MAG: DUF2934 domain-containing protein [Gammaproteobacteria bacterium]|nr:DUF2934 domain-containing protein [Gammaproteobacteria bacterium]